MFTDKSDPRVVAAVLKNYLEALPEPVILSSLYYEFNSNASTSFVDLAIAFNINAIVISHETCDCLG